MKKALVVAMVMVLGLGVLAFAGPLTGEWASSVTFSSTVITDFSTKLDIDYAVGGWAFGSTALFNLTAFDQLWFTAAGTIGAFNFNSILAFEPQTPSFHLWLNEGSVSIAGVTAYGAFMVKNVGTPDVPVIGSGALFGGFGSAGDVDIYAQVTFNMKNLNYYVWAYGLDTVVGWEEYTRCDNYYVLGWTVQTEGCTLGWNSADIIVTAPFACVDLMAEVSFSCTNGFDSAYFEIDDIDLGIPWFDLSWFGVTFMTNSGTQTPGKTLDVVFELTPTDTTCITPYITLGGTPGTNTISSISLNALLLEYTWDGVTFKAGDIFNFQWAPYWSHTDYTWGFTKDGAISHHSECIYDAAYDEYFGFTIDGDSCCGGAFDVSVFNWFITGGGTTLFDWQETVANLSLGLGSNTTLTGGISVKTAGLNWFKLGVDFTW